MRGLMLVPAVVVALLLSAAAVQGQLGRLPPNPDLEIEQISDRLFILKGIPMPQPGGAVTGRGVLGGPFYCPPNCAQGGANTGVFITDSGVVLIDTKNPGWAPTIVAKVKTITDKPITTIINTHAHADHAGGNVFFPPSVDIVVHENAKALMEGMDLFKGTKSLPTKTFKDRLSLFSGRDQIDLYHLGVGHTNGDAFVVIPSERVMFAGDMFPFEDTMVIGAENGSALNFPETMSNVLATIKGVDRIVTGHSRTVPWTALERYQRLNGDLLIWALEGRKAGQSVADTALLITQRLFISGKYEEYSLFRVRNAVQAIYDELA